VADTEVLTWLTIGGGDESIDGRTILYAALTGSLENHRGQFNLSAPAMASRHAKRP
jgi:hypothetical protein